MGGGAPPCRTVFFVDRRSGRLETFFTSAARYQEAHGVRIGMPTPAAERLLHRRLFAGCGTSIFLSSARGDLTIHFAGGTSPGEGRMRVTGGHVAAFVLHSRRRDAGVFDCL
ncbi:MAG TPA: hypothetical protein VF101_07735 [Gaiellaceae bacterium]